MLLDIVGVPVELSLKLPAEEKALVESNFSTFEPLRRVRPKVQIVVEPAQGQRYRVSWKGTEDDIAETALDELIHHVETFLVMGLQLARPELLFLHSAVLEIDGAAMMISGASGNGKSTLCWALTHHGMGYLSDELAPVDLAEAISPQVYAYPHSLNLKRCPGGDYAIPPATPFTGWTHHIPPATLKSGLCRGPVPLKWLFLVEHVEGDPAISPLSHADAAFRVYPNILNGLAHEGAGLGACKQLTRAVSCFSLKSADLAETCRLVLDTITK